MKLYAYDHCPYCIRPRMALGHFGLDAEVHFLLNDDDDTPVKLIGKKMVPILVTDDGVAMGESLDIVKKLNEIAQPTELLDEHVRSELLDWLEENKDLSYALMMPRSVKIGLAEFATQEAVDYFVNKKTAYIGDFDECFKKTPEQLQQLAPALLKLESYLQTDTSFGTSFSFEDIYVFPHLRNLTMVKGLEFPSRLKNYVKQMSEHTGVALYYDSAI